MIVLFEWKGWISKGKLKFTASQYWIIILIWWELFYCSYFRVTISKMRLWITTFLLLLPLLQLLLLGIYPHFLKTLVLKNTLLFLSKKISATKYYLNWWMKPFKLLAMFFVLIFKLSWGATENKYVAITSASVQQFCYVQCPSYLKF